jgi:hypothetical protein
MPNVVSNISANVNDSLISYKERKNTLTLKGLR